MTIFHILILKFNQKSNVLNHTESRYSFTAEKEKLETANSHFGSQMK